MKKCESWDCGWCDLSVRHHCDGWLKCDDYIPRGGWTDEQIKERHARVMGMIDTEEAS